MKPLPPLLIVADLGHVISFSRKANGDLELTDRMEIEEGLRKPSDLVTDTGGAFPNNNTQGQGTSAGERLGLEGEMEERAVKSVAKHIDQLCERYRPLNWGLAAPAAINARVVNAIDRRWTQHLRSNVPRDLTNSPVQDVASHFNR